MPPIAPLPESSPERVAVIAIARLVRDRHGESVRLIDMTYRIAHPLGFHESVTLSEIPPRMDAEDPPPALVEIERAEAEPARPVRREETGLRLAILTLLSTVDRPLKGAAIARRLNLEYSSHLRTTLAKLRHDGLIDNYPQSGYWLVSRGPPTIH